MVTLEDIFRAQIGYKDSRRSQERKDAREISEDAKAMANLPEKEINRIWQRNVDHPSPVRNDVVHNKDFGL